TVSIFSRKRVFLTSTRNLK
ncbi:ompA-like transmembrane domain protein, partial [Vibrio parahaemolyticus EKP-028]